MHNSRPAPTLGLRARAASVPVHVLATVAAITVGTLHILVSLQSWISDLGPDYGVFWTAARLALHAPALLYDPEAITEAQQPLVDYQLRLRPWAYPPTALLVFLPLGLLPFWHSFVLWVGAGVAVLLILGRREFRLSRVGLVLLLLAPGTLYALYQGQVSLFLLPLIISALAALDRRPVLAGVLFGVALVVKPQTLLLLPVALLIGRHWRALTSTALTGITLLVGSILAFGTDLWSQWVYALPEFVMMVDEYGLGRGGVAPYAVLDSLGLDAPVLAAGRLILVVTGVLVVASTYGVGNADLTVRSTALVGGSLLCSSYCLGYDLVLLVPAATAVLIAPGPRYGIGTRMAALVAPLYWLGPIGPVAFTLAVTAPCIAALSRRRGRPVHVPPPLLA